MEVAVMAVAAMAVGATAKAARAVVEKVRDARTSRASNWRRVSLMNLSPEIAPRFARIELATSVSDESQPRDSPEIRAHRTGDE